MSNLSDFLFGVSAGAFILLCLLGGTMVYKDTQQKNACIIEHKELCKKATVPISLLEGVKHEYD